MKSILMIAYFFPPEGNAGTYRPLRFVQSLSKIGWKINIISVDPYRYERYDPELFNTVPKEVNVIRVRGCDMWLALNAWRSRRMKAELSIASKEKIEQIQSTHNAPFRTRVREFVRKIEGCYYLPDQAKAWIGPAVNSAIRVCLTNKPNVIWATVGPLSSGMVAQRVSAQSGIPYVLDFRDPWGLNYYETETNRPHLVTRKVRRIMYRVLTQARSVVFLFDTVAECYQRAYPGALDDKKIHIIPNGYDGSLEQFFIPNGNKCTILYAGTLSTYRYDTFIKALALLRKSEPEFSKTVRFVFVGDGMEQLQKDAEDQRLDDMIESRPSTSYANILRLQEEAHAFLIFGRPSDRKGHELVAGAKLFSYLKARRPIIGILPQDETRKILEHVGVSTIADVDSIQDIRMTVKIVLDAWEKGTLEDLLPNPSACEAYSRECQTRALVRALNGDGAENLFKSGVADIPASMQKEIG